MKKLLISYSYPPQIGGLENYYLELCRSLDPKEICVLTQFHPNDRQFDLTQLYPIYRTEFFAGAVSPKWRPLKHNIRDIISSEKIDKLVFGHFHPFNLLGRSFRLPYVIFGHGTDIRRIKDSYYQKWIFKRAFGGCEKIILNSNYLAGEVKRLVGESEKIQVIYPGVDIARLNQPAPDLAEKKKLLGIEDKDLVMLSLGRLIAEKNFEAIIKIMPALLNILPNLMYLIVGDGPERERLETLVRQSALEYKVKFIGQIENSAEQKALYYQMAHLYVGVPADSNDFEISYLEAQATKTPVVASKAGGNGEAVADGQAGILVDPKNQREIMEAIYKILGDRQLWQMMAAAGKERMEKEFNREVQLKKIKEAIG